MKLLGSTTSPFVRKIRVLLMEKQIPFEFVLANAWDEATEVPQFNPLGKVPCLVLDNGENVFDSSTISSTIEDLYPINPMLPTDVWARARVRTLESVGDGVNDAGVAILLEKRFHEGDMLSQPWVDRQLAKIDRSLAHLNGWLAVDSKEFLAGPFGLADVAVGVALFYLDFRYPEIAWRKQYAHVAAYAARLEVRPSFQQTKPA